MVLWHADHGVGCTVHIRASEEHQVNSLNIFISHFFSLDHSYCSTGQFKFIMKHKSLQFAWQQEKRSVHSVFLTLTELSTKSSEVISSWVILPSFHFDTADPFKVQLLITEYFSLNCKDLLWCWTLIKHYVLKGIVWDIHT